MNSRITRSLNNVFVIITFCFFAFLSKYIFNIVFYHQPYVFMDEIFHVKQAKNICNGDFQTWDPKITTLPGLYATSIILIKIIGFVNSVISCNVYSFRLTNLLGTLVNFWLFYFIILKIRNINVKQNKFLWKEILFALNLSTFPVLYFFSFLYYTDVFSTSFFLLMFLFYLHKSYKYSAVAGAVSIFMRQTNVIWVLYFFALTCYECIIEEAVKQKRIISSFVFDKMSFSKGYTALFKIVFQTLYDAVFIPPKKRKDQNKNRLFKSIYERCFSYFLVLLIFAMFVYINGSIVVGDKEAHSASFHVLQVCYFTLFTIVLAWPFFLSNAVALMKNSKKIVKAVTSYKIVCISSFIILALCICFNHQAHPYLLADNRHYTFYIWKRMFGHFIIKYLLIPVYMYCIFAISKFLYSSSKIDLISFWTVLCFCLVPQQLLEFRYYIVPYYIFRLKLRNVSRRQLFLEFITYNVVNLITLAIFVLKPFSWPNEPQTVQRFMW